MATQPSTACSVTHPPVHPFDGRISSRYGIRPGRTTGIPRMHAGLDLVDSRARAPIYAIRDGVVETVARDAQRSGPFNGYGNAVVVRHGDGFWSFYAHLSSVLVQEGEQVYAGTKLGRIGNTSNGKFQGMAAHLHLEVRHGAPDGRSPFPGPYASYNIDPEEYLARYGVTFDSRGHVVLTRRACPILEGTTVGELMKHYGFGQVPLGQEYEPPAFPDPDLAGWRPSDASTGLFRGLAVGATAFIVMGAVGVTAWALRRR